MFDALKTAITSTSILASLDTTTFLYIKVDSSNYMIGAVFS